MIRLSRRALLRTGSAVAAGALLPRSLGCGPIESGDGEIDRVARVLRDTPRDQIINAAATELKNGVSHVVYCHALALAGLQSFGSDDGPNMGGPFHIASAAHAVRSMVDSLDDADRNIGLIAAAIELKSWQEDARNRIGPRLRAARSSTSTDLDAAIAARDLEAADDAATALIDSEGLDAAIDRLRAHAVTVTDSDVAHRAIFLHMLSTRAEGGEAVAAIAVRQAARSIAKGEADPLVTAATSADIPDDDARAADDADVTTLARAFRALDGFGAIDRVTTSLNQGVSHASVWEAIHLAAAELFISARPEFFFHTVHAVTLAAALHHHARHGLRAAVVLAAGRLFEHADPEAQAFDLVDASPTTGGSIDDVFGPVTVARRLSVPATLGAIIEGGTDGEQQLLAQAKQLVARASTETHRPKILAAVQSVLEGASPQRRAHLMCALLPAIPSTSDAPWEGHAQALEALG